MLWLALAVSVLVVGGAMAFTTIRAVRLFRDAKRLLRNAGELLSDIERRAAEAELHVTAAGQASERLSRSAARLRRSRAQLNVLLAAVDDVRDALGRVTSVYPTK